jgi:rare lipoprotein A (peptidoglycan hydrolase)
VKYILSLLLLLICTSFTLPVLVSTTAREVSSGAGEVTREVARVESRLADLKARDALVDSHIIEGVSKVSFYSDYFEGRLTASGTRFSNQSRQIAHKEFPFGSMIFFARQGSTGTEPGRVIATPITASEGSTPSSPATFGIITDRGPFHRDPHGRYDRDFDITYKMATELGMVEQGVVEVNWIGLKGGVR